MFTKKGGLKVQSEKRTKGTTGESEPTGDLLEVKRSARKVKKTDPCAPSSGSTARDT